MSNIFQEALHNLNKKINTGQDLKKNEARITHSNVGYFSPEKNELLAAELIALLFLNRPELHTPQNKKSVETCLNELDMAKIQNRLDSDHLKKGQAKK